MKSKQTVNEINGVLSSQESSAEFSIEQEEVHVER